MTNAYGLGDVALVTGLVDPASPTGARVGSEDDWRLHVGLEAWHRDDEVIVSTPLRVRRDVGLAELESLLARIRASEIISARVRFDSAHSAELVEILEEHEASEALVRRKAELLAPKTFVDIRFGTFTLDRRLGWYEGNASWGLATVGLTLNGAAEAELNATIQTAKKLWDEQPVWSTRFEDCAIAHLLDLKNDCWLGDREQALGAAEFRRRLTLESVTIDPDGSLEFWYDDGGLFLGHAICVSGTLTDGPKDASIQG